MIIGLLKILARSFGAPDDLITFRVDLAQSIGSVCATLTSRLRVVSQGTAEVWSTDVFAFHRQSEVIEQTSIVETLSPEEHHRGQILGEFPPQLLNIGNC